MSSRTPHKALRKLIEDGNRFEVRYAKRQSKCSECKKPIKIGEPVLLSAVDTSLYNSYGGVGWKMEKPCRFCGQHAVEYLHKLQSEVEKAFMSLDREGVDIATILKDINKGT